MKKTYIMPNCKYAELDIFELIAISNGGTAELYEGPISGEGEILSRDGGSTNLWDQEW